MIDEISGIADSKINPGYIWGQEDSGNPPMLQLIRHDGTVIKSVFLKGITNRDWEDMALCNGQVYIAETGDNNALHTEYGIYHFPEPLQTVDTVYQINRVAFTYADGSHDCEAIIVDPEAGEIYLFTKQDNPSRIYKLSPPFGIINCAAFVGIMPYSGIVSVTLSDNANEIIIKTYGRLYYYRHDPGSAIYSSLKEDPIIVPYVSEPQGEAVCFAANGSGYFTLSEQGFSNSAKLSFYKRN